MKSLQLILRRTKKAAIRTFINLFSVRTVPFLIGFLCVGILLSCSGGGGSGPEINISGDGFPFNSTLEWVAPEDVGWSSADLQEAHQFASQSGCEAAMALYEGKVFFSRGNIHKNYDVHSIREIFLSALYGIHRARGNINLDATMADLHIDDIPPGLTHAEKQARVEHLLMSRSGVYHEAAAEDQAMIDERPARGSHAPDTFFYHNNWDVNALGTIFEQETGEEICNAFKDEIADVVEMVDYNINNCSYQYQWNKSLHPAYHFKMSPRDLAKFGALYQKSGRWDDSRIIQEDWIDESTMAYSTVPDTDGLGYGYLWKIIEEDSDIGQIIGHAGYYYSGSRGYALVIVPDLKLVIVQHYGSDQSWDTPGAAGFELSMLIIDAKI
jgi:hypothetical protein